MLFYCLILNYSEKCIFNVNKGNFIDLNRLQTNEFFKISKASNEMR